MELRAQQSLNIIKTSIIQQLGDELTYLQFYRFPESCISLTNQCGFTAAVLPRYCRSTATVLPQYCRRTAAVLPRYCRSTAAVLPQYCRRNSDV